VTFVGEQQELHVAAILLERVDHLFGLDHRHVRVVRSVHHQHRGVHAVQLVDR